MREPARLLPLRPGVIDALRTIPAPQQPQSACQPSFLSQQYQQPFQQQL